MGNIVSRHGQAEATKRTILTEETQVLVKPMLTTAQTNFKDVSHPSSITSGRDRPNVTREDLAVPGAQCFLLHGLLTEAECTHYITETEKIGYSGLSDVFPTDYRSNDRVLSICNPLADELWKRIEPLITRKEVISVRPMGFGNEGTWKPFRLNECCKFGRYSRDGHFSPHIDGPWVPREDESSIFTVVIYLNTLDSMYQGGTTRFLCEDDPSRVTGYVAPRAGTALIFNHDALHEGEPVTLGVKYIIRTEIMYRRVDTEMLSNPGAYQKEESYVKTLTLYQKSWELEQVGDVKGFTDTYLQAIQLQRQAQRSISTESSATRGVNLLLPYEIYLWIFAFLTPKELCTCMTVCKGWYNMCMDGQLWYDLYQRKWPVGINLEATINPHKPALRIKDERPFLRDWFGHYKQRTLMKQPQKVVVIDMGSFSFKCAALHRAKSTIRKCYIESVVAKVPGAFDIHMRRSSYERYYCGKDARNFFPGQTVDVVVGGKLVNTEMIPEIVTGLFLDCRVRPKYTPVIILEPPGLWSKNNRLELAEIFVRRFHNPSICFLNSAVAVLCSMDLQCGVVVDVGHGAATSSVVWNREMCNSADCSPSEATPEKLASLVEGVIQKFTKNKATISLLRDHVVLTGGKRCCSDNLQKELAKSDSNYRVTVPVDVQYAAVLGGCSVANLSGFQKVSKSELHQLDASSRAFPRLQMNSVFLYWYRFLNGGKESMLLLLHRASEEERHDWKKDVAEDELFLEEENTT